MLILLVLSALFFICALILFILHFVIGVDAIWFALPLMIGAILNLISAILRLKQKKLKDNLKDKISNIEKE